MKLCGLDSFDPGYSPVTSSCEHCVEPSGCNGGEYLDQLNYHHHIEELLNTIMACVCLIRTCVRGSNFYFFTRAEQIAKGCDVGRKVHTRVEETKVL
jgi:hypothetical protein